MKRNETSNTENTGKKSKKHGILKTIIIIFLVMIAVNPIAKIIGGLFEMGTAFADLSSREYFTISDINENGVILEDERGTFTLRLIGISIDDEEAAKCYIGEKVFIWDEHRIEASFGAECGYVILDDGHILQGEMLARGIASTTNEAHQYDAVFRECEWFGEYRI